LSRPRPRPRLVFLSSRRLETKTLVSRTTSLIYTSPKSEFNGLQYRCWYYRSIFISVAVVASQNRKIRRNSDIIWTYSGSKSSKVIDLGVNRKLTCDFLLVTNSNFGHICYRFRDIDSDSWAFLSNNYDCIEEFRWYIKPFRHNITDVSRKVEK